MDAIETMVEKYHHLAKITLHKVFPEARAYATSKNLHYDDLLQFAKIGLWIGCKTWNPDKHQGTLRGYLIRNIRWNLFRSIHNENKQFQIYKSKINDENNKVNILSLNSLINTETDDLTFEDIMSFDNIHIFESNNTEKEAMSSIGGQEILSTLKRGDMRLIKLRDAGYTFQEIADIEGVTRQAICAKFVRMQRNINKKLGVVI